jgi:LysR family glycine cleavage system transcriptional activator
VTGSTIAAPHIAEGRLVPLFDPAMAVFADGHFVVYPARHAKPPEVEACLRWLLALAEAMPDPWAATPKPARTRGRPGSTH